MARYVISDASPLIGLAIVDGLAWLPALFGPVWIPPSVQREVLPGLNAQGELELAAAIKGKVLRIWRKTLSAVEADPGTWTRARRTAFVSRCPKVRPVPSF